MSPTPGKLLYTQRQATSAYKAATAASVRSMACAEAEESDEEAPGDDDTQSFNVMQQLLFGDSD
jgi:hypothetical protein